MQKMVNILCFYGMSEVTFMALKSITKECESGFDIYDDCISTEKKQQ